MNYFELFNMPQEYLLNPATLEQNYFALQRQWHPDRMAGKSEKERIEAAQKATDINQGYQTLKNPLKRAAYILELHGINVLAEKPDVEPSQELLMESMAMREALSEATDPAKLMEENTQAIKTTDEALGRAFARKDYNEAAQLTLKLQYLTKFQSEIKAKAA